VKKVKGSEKSELFIYFQEKEVNVAGRVKHMERSHRSYRDHAYKRTMGLQRVATVANKKQTIFARFKDALFHRKSPQPKGES